MKRRNQWLHRLIAAILAISLLSVACTEGETSQGPQRIPPAPPAVGSVVTEIEHDGTRFTLYDNAAGCLSVSIERPGLQSKVDTHCYFEGDQVLAETNGCGWLTSPGTTTGGCDIDLPTVFYGQVREAGIGFVCLGTHRAEMAGAPDVVSARFIPRDDRDYILEPVRPGEGPYAYLFTLGGLRYGDPPLDAPSDATYRMCEEQRPWGSPDVEFVADFHLLLADELRGQDTFVALDAGTGPTNLSAVAGSQLSTHLRVPHTSAGLRVGISRGDTGTLDVLLPWPERIQELLNAGTVCREPIYVYVTVEASALHGATDAVELRVVVAPCEPAQP
jgi:hypothetical protein